MSELSEYGIRDKENDDFKIASHPILNGCINSFTIHLGEPDHSSTDVWQLN